MRVSAAWGETHSAGGGSITSLLTSYWSRPDAFPRPYRRGGTLIHIKAGAEYTSEYTLETAGQRRIHIGYTLVHIAEIGPIHFQYTLVPDPHRLSDRHPSKLACGYRLRGCAEVSSSGCATATLDGAW